MLPGSARQQNVESTVAGTSGTVVAETKVAPDVDWHDFDPGAASSLYGSEDGIGRKDIPWPKRSKVGEEGWPGRPPARGTEEGMEPEDLLCSRNARPEKALVGRAHWKINQAPSLKRERASLEGRLVVPIVWEMCGASASCWVERTTPQNLSGPVLSTI